MQLLLEVIVVGFYFVVLLGQDMVGFLLVGVGLLYDFLEHHLLALQSQYFLVQLIYLHSAACTFDDCWLDETRSSRMLMTDRLLTWGWLNRSTASLWIFMSYFASLSSIRNCLFSWYRNLLSIYYWFFILNIIISHPFLMQYHI